MSLFDNGIDQIPKFEDLVGEGKKYKTNEDAAKALIEKDRFIEQLKTEKAQVLAARPAADRSQEILDRLEALSKKEPVTEQRPDPVLERTEVKGLSVDDVDQLLNQREQKRIADANVQLVKEKLLAAYGDKYGEALKSIGEKNGLSAKALDDLAAQAPQLVINLIGSVKPEKGFTAPSSSLQPFTPSAGNPRTRSWYENLKATDREKYFSAATEAQQYKDAMSLGEAFEDM